MAIPEELECCDDTSHSKCTSKASTEMSPKTETTERERILQRNQNLHELDDKNPGKFKQYNDPMDLDPDSECRNASQFSDDVKQSFYRTKSKYQNYDITHEAKAKYRRLSNKQRSKRQVMIAVFLMFSNCLLLLSRCQAIPFMLLLITYFPSIRRNDTKKGVKGIKPWTPKSISSYADAYFQKSQEMEPCESRKDILEYLFRMGQIVPSIRSSLTVFPVFGLTDYFRDLEANPNMSKSEKMKYDMLRTSTFSNFPTTSPISILSLVKAGFYYEGVEDEVICFSCRVRCRHWRQGDDPVSIHRGLSPNCAFVHAHTNTADTSDNGPNANTILYSRDALENGSKRKDVKQQDASSYTQRNVTDQSSDQRNHRSLMPKQTLVNHVCIGARNQHYPNIMNGNIQISRRNNLESDQQRNTIINQQQASNHNTQESCQTNVQVSDSRQPKASSARDALRPLGISIEKPKYPQFAVLGTRISSFKDWPKRSTHNPEEMSRAGFIYEGTSDFTRCFFCAGGLREWEPEDNPWIEHARWYQNCTFLRQCRGQDFMNLVQQGNIQEALDKLEGRNASASPRNRSIESNVLNMPAVVSVLEMDYSTNVVENAVKHLSNITDSVELKSEDILRFILEKEEMENTDEKKSESTRSSCSSDVPCLCDPQNGTIKDINESLMKENRRLQEEQTCKICMDEDISVVFLPCGHMVTCVNCAPAVRRCLLCEEFIKGTVKAIWS